MFFKKLEEIPEENKALYAKIDELNAAVRLVIEVWLIFSVSAAIITLNLNQGWKVTYDDRTNHFETLKVSELLYTRTQ